MATSLQHDYDLLADKMIFAATRYESIQPSGLFVHIPVGHGETLHIYVSESRPDAHKMIHENVKAQALRLKRLWRIRYVTARHLVDTISGKLNFLPI